MCRNPTYNAQYYDQNASTTKRATPPAPPSIAIHAMPNAQGTASAKSRISMEDIHMFPHVVPFSGAIRDSLLPRDRNVYILERTQQQSSTNHEIGDSNVERKTHTDKEAPTRAFRPHSPTQTENGRYRRRQATTAGDGTAVKQQKQT